MPLITRVSNDIRDVVLDTLREFNGGKLVRRWIKVRNNQLIIRNKRIRLDKYRNIYVIGFGKASGEMARTIDEILGEYITKGLVIVPKEIINNYGDLRRIKVMGGSHPYPTNENVNAAKRLVGIVESAGEKDLVLCLISGGGSALLTYPAAGISLDDMVETTRLVMEAGGDIYELNTVRKHLSRVKGGNLAKTIYPANLIAIVLSDVVGDDLSTIASGPTSPDPTTYEDAVRVLDKYKLLEKVPKPVIRHLTNGVKGLVDETPKPGDPIFKRVTSYIIGNNRDFLMSIGGKLVRMGYRCRIITSFLTGEAREAGKVIASIGKMIIRHNKPFKKPIILLFGGETTVTVKGRGRGGRNQELALSTALELYGFGDYVVCSIASDGVDGNSPAAGAIYTNMDVKRIFDEGLDPTRYLRNNDSYGLAQILGTTIMTGYTGTNVNDAVIMAIV